MGKGFNFNDFFDPGNPLFYVGLLFFPLFLPVYLIYLAVQAF